MSPWQPLGPSPDDEPVRLRESLDRVARKLGTPDVEVLTGVFARWDEVVGAAVAAHTRPLSLRDGMLKVAVDEPGWATQLRYLTTDILRRCDEVFGPGAVRHIDVRVRGARGG